MTGIDSIRKWAQDVVDSRIEALAQEIEEDSYDYKKWDILKTDGYKKAMEDVASGRVESFDSVDDFIASVKKEIEEEDNGSVSEGLLSS